MQYFVNNFLYSDFLGVHFILHNLQIICLMISHTIEEWNTIIYLKFYLLWCYERLTLLSFLLLFWNVNITLTNATLHPLLRVSSFLYYFYHLIKYLLFIVHLCNWNVSSVVSFSTESPVPWKESDTGRWSVNIYQVNLDSLLILPLCVCFWQKGHQNFNPIWGIQTAFLPWLLRENISHH